MSLDSSAITVGGESAGAACASILATSPRAKGIIQTVYVGPHFIGLFHRVLMRSGSSMAPWAVRTRNTVLNTELLAHWLDCGEQFPNNAAVKACLQSKPVVDILREWRQMARN